MSILEYLGEFQWFWAVLKERSKKKEFGQLEEFPDFDRLDLLSLIGLYHNVRGRIGRSGLHETCR